MAKPNILLGVVLDLTNKKFIVTDSTDYTALGLNANDISIALKLYTPIGVLYENINYATPNTTPDLFGNTRTFEYNLPLSSGGCFIQGEYKVKASLSDTEDIYEYELKESINYKKKDISIAHEIDCFCAGFKSIDKTDYKDSIESTYIHTINYPSETNEPDNVYGGKVFTENRLANGVYVSEIETERYWEFGLFRVLDVSKGKATIQVDCGDLCKIKCAFNNLWDKYKNACGKNKARADDLLFLLQKATALITMLNLNRKCGEVSKSDSVLRDLKNLLGDCDCGCGGCEDEDIWVSGVCGGGGMVTTFEYIFQSCNNLINITPSENNGVITYTFCLDTNVLDSRIDNSLNVLINSNDFINYISSIIPEIPTVTNIGGEAEVYKQVNNNNEIELRTFKVNIDEEHQSSLGEVQASFTHDNDNVILNLDFSDIKAPEPPPVEGSAKFFYVLENKGNFENLSYTPDGSLSKPYYSWETVMETVGGFSVVKDSNKIGWEKRVGARDVLIGTTFKDKVISGVTYKEVDTIGSIYLSGNNNGANVIFLSNVTSNEDLSLSTITYEFQKSSVFTYTGTEEFVVDFKKLFIANNNIGIRINFNGIGVITRSDLSISKQGIIRVFNNNLGGDTYSRKLDFLPSSNITLREKAQDRNNFTLLAGKTAGNGNQIYGRLESSGFYNIGLLVIENKTGSNSSSAYVRAGANLIFETNTQSAIIMLSSNPGGDSDSLMIYGNIEVRFIQTSTHTNIIYNSFVAGEYTPATDRNIIEIYSNGKMTFNGGAALNYTIAGSILSGGFNSFICLRKGSFVSTFGNITLNKQHKFNSVFDIQNTGNTLQLGKVTSSLGVLNSIFQANAIAEATPITIVLSEGVVETSAPTIYGDTGDGSTFASNVTMKCKNTILKNITVFDTANIPNRFTTGANTTETADYPKYPKGTLYKMQDTDNVIGKDSGGNKAWILAIKNT